MKRKFEYEPWPSGLVDVYVRGVKVVSGHNAMRDHVYLAVDFKDAEVELKPHDSRIPIGKKEAQLGTKESKKGSPIKTNNPIGNAECTNLNESSPTSSRQDSTVAQ